LKVTSPKAGSNGITSIDLNCARSGESGVIVEIGENSAKDTVEEAILMHAVIKRGADDVPKKQI